jgi:hypothetical protein
MLQEIKDSGITTKQYVEKVKKVLLLIALPIFAFIAISISSLRFRTADSQHEEMWE